LGHWNAGGGFGVGIADAHGASSLRAVIRDRSPLGGRDRDIMSRFVSRFTFSPAISLLLLLFVLLIGMLLL